MKTVSSSVFLGRKAGFPAFKGPSDGSKGPKPGIYGRWWVLDARKKPSKVWASEGFRNHDLWENGDVFPLNGRTGGNQIHVTGGSFFPKIRHWSATLARQPPRMRQRDRGEPDGHRQDLALGSTKHKVWGEFTMGRRELTCT